MLLFKHNFIAKNEFKSFLFGDHSLSTENFDLWDSLKEQYSN